MPQKIWHWSSKWLYVLEIKPKQGFYFFWDIYKRLFRETWSWLKRAAANYTICQDVFTQNLRKMIKNFLKFLFDHTKLCKILYGKGNTLYISWNTGHLVFILKYRTGLQNTLYISWNTGPPAYVLEYGKPCKYPEIQDTL